MMTIEEAICHCRDRAKDDCSECSKEHFQLAEWLEELMEYKQLDEKGLLLRLPCKVGDTLYKIYKSPTKCSTHGEYRDDYSCFDCEEKVCDSSYKWSIYKYKTTIKEIVCLINEIGKTVFLTKAEAEKALKEISKNS